MNIISLAQSFEESKWTLQEIIRRVVDGTVIPIFVDYSNNRVIIGGTSSLGNGAKFQVQGSDVEVTTAGNGFICQNRAGTKRYRILVENDGTLTADPILP